MMMADNKKKLATIIVAKMKPKSNMESEAPESESEPSQLEIAAEEAMSAIEKKDAKAFAEALKSFMDLCEYESEDQEEESDMESES